MGKVTKGDDTERFTFHCRKDNEKFIETMNSEHNWDKSDVINRAVMYYRYKLKEGELDDPMVGDEIEESLGSGSGGVTQDGIKDKLGL